MRVEYGSVEKDGSPDLDADWLDGGWLALFRKWIDDAERAGRPEPNAFVLATVAAGRPVSRSVLCKSVDETGITFFTNYDSAKGERAGGDAVRLGDFPLVSAGTAVPYPRPGDARSIHRSPRTTGPSGRAARSWARGRRTSRRPIASRAALLEQLAEVTGALRRLRAGPGAAELGRLSHRARGGGVLARPGKPGAQPDTGRRRSRRAAAALAR